ncbi:hypothetical protein, partial [Streptomyces katrae]|uniref:hypothetical protein n=1 Tax=Streptomyces katrae TaxID=68223 RepID=UPI0012FED990
MTSLPELSSTRAPGHPGAGRRRQRRADGGDGAAAHQDVGVLECAEGAVAEGGVHRQHQGGPAEQDRRAAGGLRDGALVGEGG